ncbi:HAD-IA family hydrolase [Streptomyces sp. NPDC001922]|uniref:HAD family hydrolase n=1 Tax=Streptomyces sp. NPDC001922 TaxID=3364624 RepID=UPI0036BB26C3
MLPPLRAVVFDTDGVITDSAGLHAAAWKVAFDACLRAAPADDRSPSDGPADDRSPSDGPADDRSPSDGPADDRSPSDAPPDDRSRGDRLTDDRPSGTEDRRTAAAPTRAPPTGAHRTVDRRPFDLREDYRRYVDGKSRLDGAAAFLTARGLALPDGRPDDPPGTATVRAVAARKEQVFTDRLREHGIAPYPGTVRLLTVLARHGVPCAAVSASRHATELLTRAGVRERFAAVVDGNEAARLELPGKPHPALFLEAARRLGVPAADAAVIEDALAGVEAGRRGGFALVVGVDRTAGPTSADDLREHGADLVVRDLADLLARPGPAAAGE